MNAPITNIRKDRWGKWVAESRIDLAGDRQLKIRTSKNDRGALITSASVCQIERDRDYYVEKFQLYGDYLKSVRITQPARVTSKVVEAQQALALAEDLQIVLDDVKAFYAAKGIEV